MRTIKDILAIDPNARFSCDDVEHGAFPGDEILEQIGYCDEIPVVTYCKPNYFAMDAVDILEREAECWTDAYEDYELHYSIELKAKLQAVLDEIVEYEKAANTSYSCGEELDISEEWKQLKGE
ncbi:MAG: hypothetical protein K2X04_01020 [Burkholderiales bacterium]|jgi:hypothetical protein|nr:hypothetical protein [Burkholderiales bacterium]